MSRESQLVWLTSALKKTGLSGNALAMRAGVNPATIYRFLSGSSDNLRPRTINRLARAALIDPPEFCDLGERGAQTYILQELPQLGPLEPNLFAVKVLDESMAAAGIESDDILIFDRLQAVRQSEIVCAQLHEETLVRYLEPPFLVAASNERRFRKPILIDEHVKLTGALVRLVRVRDFDAD